MKNCYAIKGSKIFDGYEILTNHVLVVEDDLVKDILHEQNFLNDYQKADMKIIELESSDLIAPGFIDLHINGCGGVNFNADISEKALSTIVKTSFRFGCTSVLPTIITCGEEDIKKAVTVATEFYHKNPFNSLGIHIEGPYISKIKKGIHNPEYIKPISDSMVDFLLDSAKHMPIKITLAPEENHMEHIKKLANHQNIFVSLGHSNATFDVAKTAFKNGVSLGTHLFNAMSPMEGRNPGVVGAVLSDSNVAAGIIVDGHHVSYDNVSLVSTIKKDKLYFVTDAVDPMGTDMKEFRFADQLIYVKDDKCVNDLGTLSGAKIDMLSSFHNCINYANISLVESLKMGSLYAARAFKLDHKLGKLLKGYVANFFILDVNLKLKSTYASGKKVV